MSDRDELALPPRRPLPPAVRDRLRATALRQPHVRPASNRMALVVAAGVAVLAMGATVVTQAVAGSHDTRPATTPAAADGTPPPLDIVAVKADMSRCWRTIANTPSARTVPALTDWQAIFAATWDGVTVTAMRAAGRPLFCETTRTTVTLSNPNAEPVYAAGSHTAALLAGTAGVVTGVMDPRWRQLAIEGIGRSDAGLLGPHYFQGGLFVGFTGIAGTGTRYTVTRTDSGAPAHPILDLPPAPAALAAQVDRPDPPADRTSPAGRFLGDCIAHTDFAVPDPDSWQPVVMTTTGNTPVVLARSASATAVCSARDQHLDNARTPIYYVFQQTGELTPAKPLWSGYDAVVSTGLPGASGLAWIALGVVRPDVTSVEFISPAGESIPAVLANDTFTARFGEPFDTAAPGSIWRQVTVVLRDETGRELYRGPIKVSF